VAAAAIEGDLGAAAAPTQATVTRVGTVATMHGMNPPGAGRSAPRVRKATRATTLAKLLNAARRRAGLTQEQLATRLRVSHGSVKAYELGVRVPVGRNLARVEKFIAKHVD
jgi:ribosome-binding protein aMBF1 (putative translation factor)